MGSHGPYKSGGVGRGLTKGIRECKPRAQGQTPGAAGSGATVTLPPGSLRFVPPCFTLVLSTNNVAPLLRLQHTPGSPS